MDVCLKAFTKLPNSADVLSRYIADRLFGRSLDVCGSEPAGRPNLVLLGSILEWADGDSTICGAGYISASGALSEKPRHIVSVRGPLTARRLQEQGLEAPSLLSDPGVLALDYFPSVCQPRHPVGLVPHYVDASSQWVQTWRDNGVPVVDVFAPLPEFFAQLQDCRVILASSLHGLIFAHAFERPALWIELSERVLGDGFKFYDYYGSLGLDRCDVQRVRVTDSSTPLALAKLATVHSHLDLRRQATEAVNQAREILEVGTFWP